MSWLHELANRARRDLGEIRANWQMVRDAWTGADGWTEEDGKGMSLIRITAALPNNFRGADAPLRAVHWKGQVDWPGAPGQGDTWFHCGEWGGELFHRVGFNAPVQSDEPGMDLEVETTGEVLRHLVDEHGFSSEWTP